MASSQNDKNLPKEVVEDIVKLIRSVDDMIQNFNLIRKPIIDTSQSVPEATKQLDKVTQETEKATHRMLDLIEGITDREIDTAGLIGELLENKQNFEKTNIEKLQKIQENAENSQNDSFLIMDSLQFQDITTQQIYHASALLTTIEDKLQSLLQVIGEAFKIEDKVNRVYDPEATTEDQQQRQQSVDELIKAAKKATTT